MQKEVIDVFLKKKIKAKVKVLVGGGPTTREWAREIGADGWAGDAVSAVKLAKDIVLNK